MSEMSIVLKISEIVNQYEEELLYDVESHNHKYVLEYNEITEKMFLKLEESYYTDEGKWVNNYDCIERYNITPSMYANIRIIILREHLLIMRDGGGMINNKCMSLVKPQLVGTL